MASASQSLTLILKSFDKKYKISKIALALKDSLGLRSLSLLHWAKAVKDSKDYNIVDFYTKLNIKKQKRHFVKWVQSLPERQNET